MEKGSKYYFEAKIETVGPCENPTQLNARVYDTVFDSDQIGNIFTFYIKLY